MASLGPTQGLILLVDRAPLSILPFGCDDTQPADLGGEHLDLVLHSLGLSGFSFNSGQQICLPAFRLHFGLRELGDLLGEFFGSGSEMAFEHRLPDHSEHLLHFPLKHVAQLRVTFLGPRQVLFQYVVLRGFGFQLPKQCLLIPAES